jgi:hypothetical protein
VTTFMVWNLYQSRDHLQVNIMWPLCALGRAGDAVPILMDGSRKLPPHWAACKLVTGDQQYPFDPEAALTRVRRRCG